MKTLYISRGELAYAEALEAKLRRAISSTQSDDGKLMVIVSEWADGAGVIRSSGAIGNPSPGGDKPLNNF